MEMSAAGHADAGNVTQDDDPHADDDYDDGLDDGHDRHGLRSPSGVDHSKGDHGTISTRFTVTVLSTST